jgi:hypothetical protein
MIPGCLVISIAAIITAEEIPVLISLDIDLSGPPLFIVTSIARSYYETHAFTCLVMPQASLLVDCCLRQNTKLS